MTCTKERQKDSDVGKPFSSAAGPMATSSSSSISYNDKSALTTRIISGIVGSLITCFVVTPLDVVKVRLQASSPFGAVAGTSIVPASQSTSTAAAAFNVNGKSKGTVAMMRRIFAQEGLNGMYAGLRPTLIMAVPNTVLYYSAYEEMVWRLREHHAKLATENSSSLLDSTLIETTIPLWAGASARLLSSTVTAPFELLRTRQAMAAAAEATTPGKTRQAQSIWNEFQCIVRNEGGIGTLYKGLKPTLYRDVPFSAIYWLFIEQFRILWKQNHNGKSAEPSPFEQGAQAFINGAVAGMLAAAFTTPFDVIKTRQQAFAQHAAAAATSNNVVSTLAICNQNKARVYGVPATTTLAATATDTTAAKANTWKHLRYIAKTEGIGALWSGNLTRMLKVAPTCAIIISSYELGKRMMESSST